MKYKLFLISLFVFALNHGMDDKQPVSYYYTFTIFGALNWHQNPFGYDFSMCERVQKLVESGVDVNQKETVLCSAYRGMTPLEMAVTVAECNKCAHLLRQHGAQDTERIFRWQKWEAMKKKRDEIVAEKECVL